jgi:hypothetical protein
MQKNPTAKWFRRFLIGISIFLLLLFAVVELFLNRYLEHVLEKRLESLIIKGSDSLYRFRMDKLNISFWAGKVEVKNLQIRVDSNRYTVLENTKSLPLLTFEVDLPRGVIEGIDILPLLVSRKIKVNDIISSDAVVRLSRHFRDTEERNIKKGQPLWKVIENDISEIRIGKFILDSVKLHYSNADSAKAFRWQFDHCSASFDNIRIDSAGHSDSDRIMFTKNMAIVFNEVRLRTVDSLYWINADKIFYTSEKDLLDVQKFSMHPAMTTEEFYRKVGKQKDRYDLKVASLDFSNFKLERFINNDEIFADSVKIQKPDINVYFDRTAPVQPENKLGHYPPQLLLNASVNIRIKKMTLSEGTVTYTEKDSENLGEGKVTFTNINGIITNVTNHPSDIIKDSICRADITGTALKKTTVHAKFDFFLSAPDGSFAIAGDVKDVDAAELNAVTVPLAKTNVSSLHMREMSFTVTGNEKEATGNMHMLYNDLVVQLNTENKAGGGLKKRKLLTKLINKLAIRNDNPLGNQPEKVAQKVKHVRDPHRSFFAIIWQTLFACFEVITTNVKGLRS